MGKRKRRPTEDEATGITNRPRAEEADEQAHVPPRGARKGEDPPDEDPDADTEDEEADER